MGEPPFNLDAAATFLEQLVKQEIERGDPLPVDRLEFNDPKHQSVFEASGDWRNPVRLRAGPGPAVGPGMPMPVRGVNLEPATHPQSLKTSRPKKICF